MTSVHSLMLDGARITKQHLTGTGTDEFEERSCFSPSLSLGLVGGISYALPCHIFTVPREVSSVGMWGI